MIASLLIRIMLLVSLMTSTTVAQVADPDDAATCSVCGLGNKVGNPNAIFRFPGQPPITCGILELLGETGFLQQQCSFITTFIQADCDCQSEDDINNNGNDNEGVLLDRGNETVVNPTPAPAPIIAANPSTPLEDSCSVCGAGNKVGSPNSLFEFPGQPVVTCEILEQAGQDGLIPLAACSILPGLLSSCDCQPTDDSAGGDALVSPAVGPCSVCGTGLQVGNPDTPLEIPRQYGQTCGALEQAGENGLISLIDCPFLPQILLDPCDCRLANDNYDDAPPCNICMEPDRRIFRPDGIILAEYGFTANSPYEELPDYLIGMRCDSLQTQAAKGGIDEIVCYSDSLRQVIDRYCGGCRNTPQPSYPSFSPRPPISPVATPDGYPEESVDSNDDYYIQRSENKADLGMIFLIVVALCVGCNIACCCMRSKSLQPERGGGGASNNATNSSTAASRVTQDEAAKFDEEEEKVRPLVLDVLFPGQEVCIDVVYCVFKAYRHETISPCVVYCFVVVSLYRLPELRQQQHPNPMVTVTKVCLM